MSSFLLDDVGDLAIINNSLTLNSGNAAVTQHLQIHFQIFLGEWFLDTQVGVPWFRDVLIKNPSFAVVQQMLKAVILDTPGVLQILSFSLVFDSPQKRNLSLTFKALGSNGIIDFSQLVQVNP